MSFRETILGIDLGGTNLRIGLFNTEGEALSIQTHRFNTLCGHEEGIHQLITLIENVRHSNGSPPLLGIGAGVTGPVDPINGLIQNPYTLPTWENLPFTETLKQHFGIPVVLENDADAAALGEYWQGAGRGVSRLLAVTVGTGIGTALILDGRVYRGLSGTHPEGGHHIIDPSGPLCYCGAYGCWESLASGKALSSWARYQAENQPGWLMSLGIDTSDEIDGAKVAQAARDGDMIASEIMLREARYLALGLVNLITLYAPEVIVLSGGVIGSYDLLEPTIRNTIDNHSLMVPANQVQITPAKLGYYAGVTGAAYALLLSVSKT